MSDKCSETSTETPTQLAEIQTTTESDTPLILCEPLDISTDNLAEDIEFDADEFKRGLRDSSYFSGMYTGFINAGIPVEDCVSLMIGKLNLEMNVQLSEITAQTNIEVSKIKSIEVEKQTL